MRGKFIVVEGVEGGGKTTVIKEVLKIKKDWIYLSGFPITTKWDRFVHAHADSTLYYVYFTMRNRKIISLLRQGKTIIHDKYVYAVDSFLPDNRMIRNKIARFIFSPFFVNPDLYIYFKISQKESLRRIAMKKGKEHRGYYKYLLKNPVKIKNRIKEYDKIFNNLKCPKIVIDAEKKSIKESTKELIGAIENVS